MAFEQLTMQLILAVHNNDLQQTKELIDTINQLHLKIEDVYYLINTLSINQNDKTSYINLLDNQCVDYIISNLSNLPLSEQILFYRKKAQILQSDSILNIENYIEMYLNKEKYEVEKSVILQTLIEAITKLQDNSKISYYFSLIEKKFFN